MLPGEADGHRGLEASLDCVAKSPIEHRAALAARVYKPRLVSVVYEPPPCTVMNSPSLAKLSDIYQNYDIEHDPYFLKLQEDSATSDKDNLLRIRSNQKTYCHDQLKKFLAKSLAIFTELGPWATEYFVHAVVANLVQPHNQIDLGGSWWMEDSEKTHLERLLTSISPEVPDPVSLGNFDQLSHKVQCLIEYLKHAASADLTGLVFVQTRAACAVLAHVLSSHPEVKYWLRVGTFVGASAPTSRRTNIGELVDVKNQRNTLDDLRTGQKNLIITTSALEEGIDVSACNLVICFEKPPLLKSFIQRRGRARMKDSSYILFFQSDLDAESLSSWQKYEDAMRKQYEDDMRERENIERLEAEIHGERDFDIESTGATLSLDDSVRHLYHFCDTLPHDIYVDKRPIFSVDGCGESFRAGVRLPNSIDAAIRTASSSRNWPTEKLAKQDAALEAYIALYNHGLISEHLLPISKIDEVKAKAYGQVQKIPSLVEVQPQICIWSIVDSFWQRNKTECATIRFSSQGVVIGEIQLLLPNQCPRIPKLTLFWDENTEFVVQVHTIHTLVSRDTNTPASITDEEQTDMILRAVFGSRMSQDKHDFMALLRLKEEDSVLASFKGTEPAAVDSIRKLMRDQVGLIRDAGNADIRPFIFDDVALKSLNLSSTGGGRLSKTIDCRCEAIECLQTTRLPKRTDFLHRIHVSEPLKASKGRSYHYLLPEECCIDHLPFKYARIALLLPSVLHVIEHNMLAEHLATTLLKPIGFTNLQFVLEAVTATAAQEAKNYQRLEFLGDSHLKYLTSLTLSAQNPRYHEGILSHQKDHIVSNANLARATLAAGLDQYIISKPFTGKKWRPLYRSDFLDSDGKMKERHDPKREMSTKTLADVVEALVGAAYLDGGTPKAIECLKVFLSDVSWASTPELVSTLYEVYAANTKPIPVHFSELETLLGYDFRLQQLMVEALTHPAYQMTDNYASYQRLEFLGDAILDVIVSTKAYQYSPPPSVHRLHLIRTALVNKDFLAFLCMHHSMKVPKKAIITTSPGQGRKVPPQFGTMEEVYERYIWHFLRHTSPKVRAAQVSCSKRFSKLRQRINDALSYDNAYPWALLAGLDAPKFFSDIIESLIGAIYIDSRGDLGTCEAFLRKLGILGQLERVLKKDINLLHPKEELGMVADREAVKYMLGVQEQNSDEQGSGLTEEERRGGLICTIVVGDQEVSKVKGGVSRIEVETRAAQAALKFLQEREGEKTQTRSEAPAKTELNVEASTNLAVESTDQAQESSASESEVDDDTENGVELPHDQYRDEHDDGHSNDRDMDVFYDADEDIAME